MQGLSIHPLPNRIPLWRGKGWGAEWAFTRKRVRLFRESWEKQRNRIPGSIRGKSRRGERRDWKAIPSATDEEARKVCITMIKRGTTVAIEVAIVAAKMESNSAG